MNLLDLKIRQQTNRNREMEPIPGYHLRPLATTTLQKPDRPTSMLVKEPLSHAPVNFVKDIKENIVNIKKAMKGESNDHDLGRINDFAMKAGAFALATYLFTKARTPMSKTMEYVGVGSFFGSMALWPKLAIAAPVKAMYGVDVDQKYKDNNGHTKKFFQDPQYLPWDLYTDEQISAMGDKLGVPREIHNRNEVIKKKAQKIALQSNTLWMLTAGVATPVGCALLCNATEKVLAPTLEKGRVALAEHNLNNIDKIAEKRMSKYNPKILSEFLEVNAGRKIEPDMLKFIIKEMMHDSDVLAPEMLEAQLSQIVSEDAEVATKEYAERFLEAFKEYRKERKITLSDGKLPSVYREFDGMKAEILDFADGKISREEFHSVVGEKLHDVMQRCDVPEVERANILEPYSKLAQEHIPTKIMKITPEAIEKIKVLDKILYELSVRKGVVDKYARVMLGDVAESVAANRWNEATETFFKTLKISDKELLDARKTGKTSYDLLVKKLEALAGDEDAYKKAVAELQQAIIKFDKMILPDAEGETQGVVESLSKNYKAVVESSAEKCTAGGFDIVRERLVGSGTKHGSLVENLVESQSRRAAGLRNGLYSMLHTLDFFRRADDVKKGWEDSRFAGVYRYFSKPHDGVALNPTADTLAEDLKLYKKVVTSGTISDYTTKFGYGNGQFGLYDRLMKIIHFETLAPATEEALEDVKLGKTSFVKVFKKKISDTLKHLGNTKYPHAESVVTQDVSGGGGDILVRDSLVGPRMDKIFRDTASNIYNSRKWLKMFGGTFAALVGVTLFAETMFGKMNPDIIHIKKDNK